MQRTFEPYKVLNVREDTFLINQNGITNTIRIDSVDLVMDRLDKAK